MLGLGKADVARAMAIVQRIVGVRSAPSPHRVARAPLSPAQEAAKARRRAANRVARRQRKVNAKRGA